MTAVPVQPTRNSRPGFTLIEALIVLVIVGAFAAVAAPRFADASQRYRARLTAQLIAKEIDRVAALARATRTAHQLTFDPRQQTAAVSRPADGQTLSTLTLGSRHDAAIYRADFGGSAMLAFDGYGRPVAGGSVITTAGGWYAALAVAPDTGQVTLSEKVTRNP